IRLNQDLGLFQAGEGDVDSAYDNLVQRSGGDTHVRAAIDSESHEVGDATAHPKFGIAGVDPGADAVGRPVGEWEVDVDDDAIVVERDGNGDGLGFGLGHEFGRALCEGGGGESKDDEEGNESHGKIVAGSWAEE